MSGKIATIFGLSAGAGYLVGRAGHVLLGRSIEIHHWLIGVALVVPGIAFRKPMATGLGTGLMISDARDMVNGEVIGPDTDEHPRFWGVG